ncbi:hypothetical protein [Hymenobacter algoricola]|uniref:Glycosyltransferase RgtA/B/C/D-like domain-containing protein n=1 Tax=Hymenobacter algoricola TaxID=486267 RepID=A0ABP7NE47_9BACT
MLPLPTSSRFVALRHHDWPLVVVLLLSYLVYLPASGYPALVFDASNYWHLTERFFRSGHFHLLAYDDGLRGYLLALLNLPAKALVHFTGVAPLLATRLMGAATAALLFGWAGPALWRRLFPAVPLALSARGAFAALGFLFWRDYFNFPLSDFPAVLALLVGLRLVPGAGAARLVVAGSLLAAAVNIRPVYLLAAPAVLVLAVVETSGAGRRGLAVAALLAGFALVSTPQLLINGRHHGQWSPLVLSRDNRFPAANLYLSQLGWGVLLQKYETTLDPAVPGPKLLYTDPAGQALLRQDSLRHFPGYAAYLREVGRRPLEFAALYGRHLFNGLDVQYASLYVRRVADRQRALALLHYSVWFGALVGLAHSLRSLRRRHLLLLASLLPPALVTVPMAMECRFLLPLHLLLYAVFCFGLLPHARAAARWSGRKKVVLIGAYVLFVGACTTLSAQTSAQRSFDLRVLRDLGGAEE